MARYRDDKGPHTAANRVEDKSDALAGERVRNAPSRRAISEAQRAREHRERHFAVEVRSVETGDDEWDQVFADEIYLRLTYNGQQWTRLTLLPIEVDRLLAALQQARKATR